MKSYNIKALALFFLIMGSFVLSSVDASAIGIKVTIRFTRGTHNEEGNCIGNKGICEWDISVGFERTAAGSDNVDVVTGEAEVDGNYLVFKFDQAANQKPSVSVRGWDIKKSTKLTDDLSRDLGYSSIVLSEGTYDVTSTGCKVKIKTKSALKAAPKKKEESK